MSITKNGKKVYLYSNNCTWHHKKNH